MNEIWKKISKYPNSRYEVSNMGRVRKMKQCYYMSNDRKKYRAYIDTDHGREQLGTYRTPEEAREAFYMALPRFPDNKGYVYITPQVTRGHLQVALSVDGRTKQEYVHRLVAMEFLDNPNNQNVVNHIDYNPLNNCYTNLEWCDQKHNVNHSKERYSIPKCGKCIRERNGAFEVAVRSVRGKYYKSFNTLEEAAAYRDDVKKLIWGQKAEDQKCAVSVKM